MKLIARYVLDTSTFEFTRIEDMVCSNSDVFVFLPANPYRTAIVQTARDNPFTLR